LIASRVSLPPVAEPLNLTFAMSTPVRYGSEMAVMTLRAVSETRPPIFSGGAQDAREHGRGEEEDDAGDAELAAHRSVVRMRS
jgi:hypothetical protein